jgi:hypothetical protein
MANRVSILRTTNAKAILETFLIAVLFSVLAGSPPPGVNEAHYLAKAKHYWNPEWCTDDFFLNSADAHAVFYWTLGWLTMLLPLDGVAWIGRWLNWLFLAWAWRRLSHALIPRPLAAVFSAALFACLQDWGHMAGEWVIGGVEAKGFSYGFVFLGLEALVRARWRAVWPLLGAASSLHVLVGGWSVIAAMFAWCCCRPRPPLRTMLPWLMLGLVLALPGLLPALALTRGADAQTVTSANIIYVFHRLSHHLVFHRLPTDYVLRHAILLTAWVLLWRFVPQNARSGRLHAFVAGAVLIAAGGIAIDVALRNRPDLAAGVLRYYWYRLSDVLVPLGATFAGIGAVRRLADRKPIEARLWVGVALIVLVGFVGNVAWQRWTDRRPEAIAQSRSGRFASSHSAAALYRAWRDTCQWIDRHTPRDAVFLTPRAQQTFKWYAGRSEVAVWKDIPQDAAAIVAWRQRIADCYPPMYGQIESAASRDERLGRLARKYNFDYIVVDRTVDPPLLSFPKVYPSDAETQLPFEVYRVDLSDGSS